MRGVDDALGVLAGFLEARMPAKVDELAARLELPAVGHGPNPELGSLPAPAFYSTAPVTELELDKWPAVLVLPFSTPRVVGDGQDDEGRDRYVVRYLLRVVVLARGQTFDDVAHRLRRLALGVRELVLAERSLGDAGVAVPTEGMNESWSEVEDAGVAGSTAGMYLELNVDVDELVAPIAPAYAGPPPNVVTVVALPRHPALD